MPSASSSGPYAPCPFISDVSPNPTVTCGVQVGSNGSGGGSPGLIAGPSTADVTWDNDLSDGFDSGWVSIRVAAWATDSPDGVMCGIELPDGTVATVNYAIARPGNLNNVQIRAAVSASNMRITFRSILIQYYHGEGVTQSIEVPDECSPMADTTGTGVPSSASEVIELPPDSSDYTGVVIVAAFVMQSPQTTPLPLTAITGQILIFANS